MPEAEKEFKGEVDDRKGLLEFRWAGCSCGVGRGGALAGLGRGEADDRKGLLEFRRVCFGGT